MQLSRRLVLTLLGGVATVSLAFAILQARAETSVLEDEIQRQAAVLAESQVRPAEFALKNGLDPEVLVDRFENQDHLAGMAVYDERGHPLAITSGLRSQLKTTPAAVISALDSGEERAQIFHLGDRPMQVFVVPLRVGGRAAGALAVFHHAALIATPVLRHAMASVAQTLLIVALTLLIVRWNLGKPVQHLTEWLRDLRTGRTSLGVTLPKDGVFQPLTNEVTRIATSLNAARRAAEEEARLRDAALSRWTPERLRVSMQSKMDGSRLFAVSNREPYEHVYRGSTITWSVPPSGLVTALEPVLRACDGTWIAQGTGDADRETADKHGRLRVPPDHPQYTLRRVWLDEEEEEGFYFGFANEGLWPLCHIAHTRPVFRAEDWEQYRAVNQKFADVLMDEMESERRAVGAGPGLSLRTACRAWSKNSGLTRAWPFSGTFRGPIRKPSASALGNANCSTACWERTCSGFISRRIATIFWKRWTGRSESRIDWEHFAVNRREHVTSVRPFPISVAFLEQWRSTGQRACRTRFVELGEQAVLRWLGRRPPRLHQRYSRAVSSHRAAARPAPVLSRQAGVCADRRA